MSQAHPINARRQALDDPNFKFTAEDIRFTRKGDDIYAATLGVPAGQLLIRALAKNSPFVSGEPSSITLLGDAEKLQWSRTSHGIVITLPSRLPCSSAMCFKISGLTTVANLDPSTLRAFKNQEKNN